MICYLNGEFVDHATAVVSVDDRGFLFADGVYEVIRVYDGRPFLMQQHMERLKYGLRELRITAGFTDELVAVADRLIGDNDLRSGDSTIYMQITRGAAPRAHAFPPAETPPTVYVIAKPFKNHPEKYWSDGVAAVTVPDTRWSRCDIKSIALLPNVLANQAAKDAGAFEAVFVRDGALIEGSHSNLWGVIKGEAVTYDACGYILSGITRNLVLERAGELGVTAREAPLRLDDLAGIEELFLTGTTTEIMPVVKLDDHVIGDGTPGPLTRKLMAAYREWCSQPL